MNCSLELKHFFYITQSMQLFESAYEDNYLKYFLEILRDNYENKI